MKVSSVNPIKWADYDEDSYDDYESEYKENGYDCGDEVKMEVEREVFKKKIAKEAKEIVRAELEAVKKKEMDAEAVNKVDFEAELEVVKKKRKLTEVEILFILDFLTGKSPYVDVNVNEKLKYNLNANEKKLKEPVFNPRELDVGKVILQKQFKFLKAKLKNVEIYPRQIFKLKKMIYKDYIHSQLEPGFMAGIHAATAISEPCTQLSLKTFQTAGQTNLTMCTGVPRIDEIIRASKLIKVAIMTFDIKIKPFPLSDVKPNLEKRKSAADSDIESFMLARNHVKAVLEEKTIEDFLETSSDVSPNSESIKAEYKREEDCWYAPFKETYHHRFKDLDWSARLVFSKSMLFRYKITMASIAERIETEYNDIVCAFSPEHLGILDIYALSYLPVPTKDNTFTTEENKYFYMFRDNVIPRIKFVKINGLERIKEAFLKDSSEEAIRKQLERGVFSVQTLGSNVMELMKLEDVDFYNVQSNNIWEIYNVLGVEASRSCLINELSQILSMGAGSCDDGCHLELLADAMTSKGTILPVSRKTTGSNNGPLSRASFEQSSENLIIAAKRGELDDMQSVSSSIILGQSSRAGTGIVGLVTNQNLIEKLFRKDEIPEGIIRSEEIFDNMMF